MVRILVFMGIVAHMAESRPHFSLGRNRRKVTSVWRELVRATEAAKIGHLGTHAFRHTYHSWLDAVETPVAVQQK